MNYALTSGATTFEVGTTAPLYVPAKKLWVTDVGHFADHTGKEYTPGASLFMWEAYFPNADIYALDIDPSVLVNQGRIRSFQCDQGDGGSLLNVLPYLGHGFDFIVDDGSHIPEHQVKTARTFFPLLASGGIYAIEDIPLSAREFVASQLPWKSGFHEVIDIYGGIGDLVLVLREGDK